jgi:sialic acid synthase
MLKTKILLELGCNHQGNIYNAIQMIDEAAKLGAWGIKFQKRDCDLIPKEIGDTPRKPENSFGTTYYEHRKALEFSVDQIASLKEYAEKAGLKVVVTVFDLISMDQMIRAGFEYIKLPSQFYSNYAMNLKLFDMKIPMSAVHPDFKIIVSTGMHTMREIELWPWFDKSYITMYCRSIYPCELNDIDFKMALSLKEKLKKSRFGYSSHDKQGCAIPYMVLLGAEYVERHYTLNKEWKGSDHGTVSSDFQEMQGIIKQIEEMESLSAVDNSFDLASEAERKVRLTYRGI